jgi:tRNA-splicing ligase RtcB (3'-phosphate/5'-hydroxy nucleic acid ligase)
MRTIERNNGNHIKIYAATVEDTALDQIKELGEFEPYKNSKIRIMPDCHAGAGCTIGTTMEIKNKITPNLVGVDIGCGMLTVKLVERGIDLPKLDSVINENIPNGFNIHSEPKAKFDFSTLTAENLNIDRAKLSLGSLGGGNHFIEVGKNQQEELFLVIHSGSRNIGGQVAKYYQDRAIDRLYDNAREREDLIETLKREGREKEIGQALKNFKKPAANKDLAYVTGTDFDNYMHDMKVMQEYALLNRRTMADIILKEAGLTEDHSFETIHNYIDFKRMILRKGAVSAEKGEVLLIPINMRDGSIIARGKGNPEWNFSAPHGAGRLMGRKQAHRNLDLDEFKEQMKDVYSTSVTAETLDEAPNAYKPMSEILKAIEETAEIVDIIRPIYNFKAHS